jgi:hypothetical protein
VRDDLSTKRLAGQLMQGLKTVHEENTPGRALGPGAPVRPHMAAEASGSARWGPVRGDAGVSGRARGCGALLAYRQRCGGAEVRAGRARPEAA